MPIHIVLTHLILSCFTGNRLYNNDDGTVINFNSSGHCPRMDEAGYAKVGSPCRKGYAFLEPGPERTRSEYQRLVKPGEGKMQTTVNAVK